jgi:hypothetical protein
MWRRVGLVASAVVLATLTAARPASADVVYVGSGAGLREPVPLALQIKEQRAELRVYRREDRLDLVAPLVVCQGNCMFKLLPGAYKLELRGPPESDIQTGSRLFDLRGPSSLYVDPPSSTARFIGLGMGLLGPGMMVLGLALFSEAQNHEQGVDRDKQFAGGALLVGGTLLTVGGWIMFAKNGKPTLVLEPLRPRTSPPAS